MKVSFGYGSDARVRGENQDAHGVFEIGDLVLAVVCDGVGGHTGGQQAATLAVRTVAQAFQDGVTDVSAGLIEAITLANRTIYEAGRKSHRLMGMSTTIVAVAVRDDIAYVAHVGDSRAYLTRGTEIMPLTRDHTMVNMFVDNDLLSPEDAASHPEAHVLARSLGSERQVDVDAHEPLSLEDGDVLLLCTDGLHGVVEESDLVSADWGRPGTAARQLLRRVAALGGNDNATAVGLRIGGRGEPGMLPTPIPSLEGGTDALTPSSSDLVHAPDLLNEPMPPALYPIEPEDEPTAYPEDPTDQSGDDMVAARRPTPSSPLPPRVTPRTPAPAPMRPAKEQPTAPRRRILLVAGVAALASIVILGAAVTWRLTQSPVSRAIDDPIDGVIVPPPDPDDPPIVTPAQDTDRDPDTDTEEVVIGQGGGECDITTRATQWVNIQCPNVRKNTRKGTAYRGTPPGARYRVEMSQKMVDSCDGAEAVVNAAMRNSPDHAPLYLDLWHCFQDFHASVLRHTELDNPQQFETVRRHLEGNDLEQPEADCSLPLWYLDAKDGIERRMDLYADHVMGGGEFDEVVLDFIDEERVASRFHHDLVSEAAFACGFRKVTNPTADQVQAWARRVYTVRKHLDSPVGELVSINHPKAYRRARDLLAECTNNYEVVYESDLESYRRLNDSANEAKFDWKRVAASISLPEEVAHALLVGAGEQAAPTCRAPEPVDTTPTRPTGPANPLDLPE